MQQLLRSTMLTWVHQRMFCGVALTLLAAVLGGTARGQSNFPPTGFISPTGLQTPKLVGSGLWIYSTIRAAPAPTYQWQFNGVDLPGETGTNLFIANAQTNQSGGYRLIASNPHGSFTSAVVELSFYHAPPTVRLFLALFGSSPAPTIVGSQFLLIAIVQGGPPPGIQWQFNGTNLPGQTNWGFYFSNAQTNQSGGYSAVVSNALGVVTSAVSVISIHEPQPVLAWSGLTPLALGRDHYLDSIVTLPEPATLQWRFHGTNLLDATNRSLHFSPLQPTDAGEYDLVATTSSGSYTSPPVTLTVLLEPPSGAVPHLVLNSAEALAGEDVSMAASHEGSPSFVQWRFNGVNLPGQTNHYLNLLGVTTNQAGNYSFSATNLAGATTSSVVTLRVGYQAPSSLTPLIHQSVIEGGTVRFMAHAYAGPSPDYFLERNGTNVAAPLAYEPFYDTNYTFAGYSAVFSLLDTTFADAGGYRIIASNFLGSVTTAVATLTVTPAGPLDRWTQRNPLPQSQPLLAIAHGTNQFVAVGERGTILTSPDGADWALQNRRADLALNGVACGGGQFVAVGAGGTVLSSTDGTNWAYRSTAAGTYLNAVAHGQGRFVAVGGEIGLGTLVLHSSDGVHWARISPNVAYAERCVAYGNGVFVAGGAEAIMRSADGTNWSLVQFVGKPVESITYAAGHFVAVGDDGSMLVSTNGMLWLPRPALTTRRLLGVTHGAGRFVAAGARGTMLTSTDALNWTVVNSGTLDRLEAVDFSEGRFVSVGENGTTITSTNGLNWTAQNVGTTRDLDGLAVANGQIVIVGKGGSILTSTDGTHYTTQDSGMTNDLHGAAWGGGRWVAVGEPGVVLTSSNAVNWIAHVTGTTSSLKNATHANGQWIVVGTGGTIVRSTNGTDWLTTYLPSQFDLNDVAFGNGMFLVAGDGLGGQNGSLHRSYDGVTWAVTVPDDPEDRPGKNLRGITFANGVFLITLNDGMVQMTGNGTHFDRRFVFGVPYGENLRAATWAHGLWIVVGNNGAISTSPNFSTWTRRASRTFENFHEIAELNGRLIAIGNRGTVLQSGRLVTELEPPRFVPGSGFQLSFQGVMQRRYEIQATTNLLHWSTLASFTNQTERTNFTDPGALDFSHRYYRLMEP